MEEHNHPSEQKPLYRTARNLEPALGVSPQLEYCDWLELDKNLTLSFQGFCTTVLVDPEKIGTGKVALIRIHELLLLRRWRTLLWEQTVILKAPCLGGNGFGPIAHWMIDNILLIISTVCSGGKY